MNEDFVEGWKAARAQYQATGGVQPYPPGYGAQRAPEPESERVPTAIGGGEPEPPKKAAPKKRAAVKQEKDNG